MIWLVLLIFVITAIVGICVWHASFSRLRYQVTDALRGIDGGFAMLRDQVPNMTRLSSQYFPNDETLMQEVVRLHAKSQEGSAFLGNKEPIEISQQFKTQMEFKARFEEFLRTAAVHKGASADPLFADAQKFHAMAEESIAQARMRYNIAVDGHNNCLEVMPGAFIGAVMKYKPYFRWHVA